jgi:exosome complex exonuclease RRP6
MQAEVPYVPVQQRQIREVVEDSSIVVVGQARQKKRKRTKSSQQQVGDGQKKVEIVETLENREAAEPFDFSGAPNILDEVQEEDRKPVKKKKAGSDKTSKGAC